MFQCNKKCPVFDVHKQNAPTQRFGQGRLQLPKTAVRSQAGIERIGKQMIKYPIDLFHGVIIPLLLLAAMGLGGCGHKGPPVYDGAEKRAIP
jgi:hypothetical protein